MRSLNFARVRAGALIALCSLSFSACQYEIPITSSPTRKVQKELLGDWISADGKETLKLRSFDDSVYIVYYDGDLFRAYHSDVGNTPFASVQDLNSSDRKYAYVSWSLSGDGSRLSLRSVNNKIVSNQTRDSNTVIALLTKNAGHPELFTEEIEFRKQK